MLVVCQSCRHSFDAPPPPTPSCCPRCFSPAISPAGPFPPTAASPAQSPLERTMAVDPAQMPPELRAAMSNKPPAAHAPLPPTSHNPFGSPSAQTSPFGSPSPVAPAAPAPATFAPASYGAPSPAPYAAPFAPAAPYPQNPYAGFGPPPGAAPLAPYAAAPLRAAEDPTFKITVSLILAILGFLGACNPIGLVGIVFALLAYQATGSDPKTAASRANVALYSAIAAFVLTGGLWFLAILGALSGR